MKFPNNGVLINLIIIFIYHPEPKNRLTESKPSNGNEVLSNEVLTADKRT